MAAWKSVLTEAGIAALATYLDRAFDRLAPAARAPIVPCGTFLAHNHTCHSLEVTMNTRIVSTALSAITLFAAVQAHVASGKELSDTTCIAC